MQQPPCQLEQVCLTLTMIAGLDYGVFIAGSNRGLGCRCWLQSLLVADAENFKEATIQALNVQREVFGLLTEEKSWQQGDEDDGELSQNAPVDASAKRDESLTLVVREIMLVGVEVATHVTVEAQLLDEEKQCTPSLLLSSTERQTQVVQTENVSSPSRTQSMLCSRFLGNTPHGLGAYEQCSGMSFACVSGQRIFQFRDRGGFSSPCQAASCRHGHHAWCGRRTASSSDEEHEFFGR